MSGLLLDTCIVIDYLRHKKLALDYVHSLSHRPQLSAVTIMELYSGVQGRTEEQDLKLLIANATVLDICGEIGQQAGRFMQQYRPSNGVDTIDAMIAATAKHHNLELVTLNLKHFPMFDGLRRPY